MSAALSPSLDNQFPITPKQLTASPPPPTHTQVNVEQRATFLDPTCTRTENDFCVSIKAGAYHNNHI